MKNDKALLIVDMQKDFCPGGKLPVKRCSNIIDKLNVYIENFLNKNLPIFASRDWHPEKTSHFENHGGIWPEHCIQNSEGAKFHSSLNIPKEAIIISKGMDPEKDSYSCFQSYNNKGKIFKDILNRMHIKTLYIGGLATDYCVKNTCLDALSKGFKVNLLIDAIEGVNLKPDDSKKAIAEIIDNGAEKIKLENLNI